MKKISIVLLIAFILVGYNSLVFGQTGFGSGTSTTIGGTTYNSYSDGTSGTSTDIGGTTYHSLSDGTSGTSTDIGGTTYNNFNYGYGR